jgi:ribonuclease PH
MKGTGKGWVTAEYSMLPGSSADRIRRERNGAKGRTQEIERLIGRSLRAVVDMERLGERQIQVDCDVLQADGGTRTTAISGAWIALHDALDRLVRDGELSETPLLDHLAAISVGVVAEVPVLDLPYVEDSTAEVDMNIVANGSGRLVEVQGTAEGAAFERATLDRLIDLGLGGISQIVELQAEAIGSRLTPRG